MDYSTFKSQLISKLTNDLLDIFCDHIPEMTPVHRERIETANGRNVLITLF